MKPDLKRLILPSIHQYGVLTAQYAFSYIESITYNIEKLEAEAIELRSQDYAGFEHLWSGDTKPGDTHRTWIFPSLTEEIAQGVTKNEIVACLSDIMDSVHFQETIDTHPLAIVLDRIKRAGIAP